MQRPKLTDNRIRGLQLMVERVRKLAEERSGPNYLYQLPTIHAHDIRSAIKYVDSLARWNEEKKA